MKFKMGDITDKVWAGDLIHKCEFICYLESEKMLFYDINSRCFRLVFWEFDKEIPILNGWKCAGTISELINI